MRPLRLLSLAMFSAALVASACGSDNEELTGTGGTGGGGGVSGDGAAGSANGSGTGATAGTGGYNPDGGISQCQGHVYECGDLLDNDNDGLIDQYDPDCLGPCDNTEASYFGGIPGQNNAPCKMDCYFDQDTGPGNDDCYWNHECDPLDVAPAYPPEGLDKATSRIASTTRRPRARLRPPRAPSSSTSKALCVSATAGRSRRTVVTASAAASCPRAAANTSGSARPSMVWGAATSTSLMIRTSASRVRRCKACLNGCGHCELCIGKETLPDDCSTEVESPADAGDGGITSQCPTAFRPAGSRAVTVRERLLLHHRLLCTRCQSED